MVVTPESPSPTDKNVTYDEERTYREATKTLRLSEHETSSQRFAALDAKIDALVKHSETKFAFASDEHKRIQELFDQKLRHIDDISKETVGFARGEISKLMVSSAADVVSARIAAQTANDALQTLLEAAMASNIKLADARFASQEVAISKTETAILTSANSYQNAINVASSASASAMKEIEKKSEMRSDAATVAVSATEAKTLERILALQQLIDLRAKMTEDAVSKANEANEKRFESVNEFRGQLSDQTREFVTIPVLDARMSQISTLADTLDRQLRIDTLALRESINLLSTRLTTREASDATKREVHTEDRSSTASIVGVIGGIVGALSLIVVIGSNLMQHQTNAPDNKRLDDLFTQSAEQSRQLGQRMDALSARLNAIQTSPQR